MPSGMPQVRVSIAFRREGEWELQPLKGVEFVDFRHR